MMMMGIMMMTLHLPQACDIAIENSTDAVIDSMVKLIHFLTLTTFCVSLDQFEKVCQKMVFVMRMRELWWLYGGDIFIICLE